MMKRWNAKPLALLAKDSLLSSFASGGLSRLRDSKYSRVTLVAYFSWTVLNWVFDKDYHLLRPWKKKRGERKGKKKGRKKKEKGKERRKGKKERRKKKAIDRKKYSSPLHAKVGQHSDIKNILVAWYILPIQPDPEFRMTVIDFKGIVSDSNNIFLWHESEDINKESLFPTFQLGLISRFQVMHDMCVSLRPQTTVLNKVSCTRLSVKNCSHFILKWFQPNSFGELCFLEESYGNMQKIQILKNLRAPSIHHQWVCL